jgi:PIN domain nuclease of toxin-antitoxin system
MAVYVTDTHPLIWHGADKRAKLSRKAARIFDAAEDEQSLIYIPLAVFWETTILLKSGRVGLPEPFDHWHSGILTRPGFDLAPLDLRTVSESLALGMFGDPFDCIIVATARVLDLPLITADQRITESRMVEVIW